MFASIFAIVGKTLKYVANNNIIIYATKNSGNDIVVKVVVETALS